jgi:acetamidase/formamidase
MPKGKKFGGRQLGTGNKISSELKEVLNEYCLNEFKFLNANIERLTLHERIILFSKVLPFVLPKNVAHEENTVEASSPIIIFTKNE